jgi:hypothetical protein
MAQFGENGLFGRVLPTGNAGSIAIPGAFWAGQGFANATFIVAKLSEWNLLNLGLCRCISLVPAMSGRTGKDASREIEMPVG